MAARTLDTLALSRLASVPVDGHTQVDAPVVKAWGRDNGFTVPEAQGRLSNALIDAFHQANAKGRNPKQYIVGTKTRGAGREFTYNRADGKGTGTFTALPEQVRAEGTALGLDVKPTGKLPQALVDAVGQARAAARAASRKPRAPRARKAEAAPEVTEGE